jgi:hypothetical protein
MKVRSTQRPNLRPVVCYPDAWKIACSFPVSMKSPLAERMIGQLAPNDIVSSPRRCS